MDGAGLAAGVLVGCRHQSGQVRRPPITAYGSSKEQQWTDRHRSNPAAAGAPLAKRGVRAALALIIAVLYFRLIELMLFDAARQLAEARRFRARIVALTLAENGAELAAANIVLAIHA